MKNNKILYPLLRVCLVMLLVFVVSCRDVFQYRQATQKLDCSLAFVKDNYPEGVKIQQTSNAMPRSLLFVYKIKNNMSKPAFLPIHSDNAEDHKNQSELSLFVDSFRIGSKTKVRQFKSEEREAYVYDLAFNEYDYVVESRSKTQPYAHEDGWLYPGDSIFVSIRVTESLLKLAGLPSDINIYDLMEKMQIRYNPGLEYGNPAASETADVRQSASRYIAFSFGMKIPEKKDDSEFQWMCREDDEADEERRHHHTFSGMSCYY